MNNTDRKNQNSPELVGAGREQTDKRGRKKGTRIRRGSRLHASGFVKPVRISGFGLNPA